MVNLYNVLIDLVGMLVVGTILLAGLGQKRRNNPGIARLMRYLLLCCMAVFLSDIPGLLMDGHIFPGAGFLLWFFDTAYWIFQIVYCWMWMLFAVYWTFGMMKQQKKWGALCAIPMAAEVLMILTTSATGWVFTIDSENIYGRGTLYLPNMLFYVFYIIAALTISIRGYRVSTDPEQKRRSLALVIYMFLPVCGVLFDAFVYGISWVWPMVALSLLMVYMNVQQQYISEEQLAAARMETELSEGRTAIMLSQIKPHFLYNTLNTIKHCCAGNPQAQKIVTDFAKYLRGNMDSLTNREPIPFSRELEHLNHYLNIEKVRFPDVEIRYDLQAESFMLPALSVQPLVENAIYHGVTCRPQGGLIFISSRADENEFTISIEDNGVGFNPHGEKADGRSHIGISNVRSRLAAMCGGELQIESEPGVGTKAVIHIPRKDER